MKDEKILNSILIEQLKLNESLKDWINKTYKIIEHLNNKVEKLEQQIETIKKTK